MASTFRKLRVVWTAGAVLVCLLPAISHGSDEVRYVPPKSPLVRKNDWRGSAFERVCIDHVAQIKKALGISGVHTDEPVAKPSF